MRKSFYEIKVETIYIFFMIIIYKFLLDFIYINMLNPVFGYSGFLIEDNKSNYFLSWVLVVAVVPFMTRLLSNRSFSSNTLLILVLISYIPLTTMIGNFPVTQEFIIYSILYWLVLLLLYFTFPKVKEISLEKDTMSNLILYGSMVVFFLTILFISGRYTGFRINFDLFNVYDLRSEANSFQLPTLISYIYSASRVINPMLIVYFLVRKQNYSAMFVIGLQLLSFSINGSKTAFFTTILAIAIFYVFKKGRKYLIFYSAIVLLITSIIEYFIFDGIFLLSFLVRRVMFLPNLLNIYYFDFFTLNPPDYLKQSFLRHIGFESDYNVPIDNLIGSIYFNQPDMGANNGLMSDAIANFGYIGLLISPLILITALKIMDVPARKLDYRITMILAITYSFVFISSFFFTTILNHGLIALVVILFVLPTKKRELISY